MRQPLPSRGWDSRELSDLGPDSFCFSAEWEPFQHPFPKGEEQVQ